MGLERTGVSLKFQCEGLEWAILIRKDITLVKRSSVTPLAVMQLSQVFIQVIFVNIYALNFDDSDFFISKVFAIILPLEDYT